MKKDIQHKNTNATHFVEVGEAARIDVRGVGKEAEALRGKFRSPYRFCGSFGKRKTP